MPNWHNYMEIKFIELFDAMGNELFAEKVVKIKMEPVFSEKKQILFETAEGICWMRNQGSVRKFTKDKIIPRNQPN